MPHPVVHFEILGQDATALQRFYARTFDWDLQPVTPDYAMVSPGEGSIPGGIGAAPEGTPGHVTFYIQVEDLADALRRIEAAGGRRLQAPMEVPGGPSIALFADPEGHVVGLVS
jgi:predicted enzyme related to lactoylglutathione lyase